MPTHVRIKYSSNRAAKTHDRPAADKNPQKVAGTFAAKVPATFLAPSGEVHAVRAV